MPSLSVDIHAATRRQLGSQSARHYLSQLIRGGDAFAARVLRGGPIVRRTRGLSSGGRACCHPADAPGVAFRQSGARATGAAMIAARMSLLPLWAGAATVAAPGLRLLLRARVRQGKEIAARLPERRGVDPTPRPPGRLLWLHAASVGETVSILPVLTALTEQAPDASMLLTTGTLTSARLLAQRLPELGLEGRVLHRFVPLDVPGWVARFLDHWQPDAAAFVESELWPNLVAACRARRVPIMLLNARLSARSFARWRRLRGAARDLLRGFARIEAQSEADAERLRALGAPAVTVPGNLKFAAPPLPVDPAEFEGLREKLRGRPVWLAASTHPGEEAIVLAAHRALAEAHPGLLTIIAPRHPERGARIAEQAEQSLRAGG